MSRLLVIDDDPDFTLGIATLLERAGHHVRVVHRAASALEAVGQECFDVAFLDLQLPDCDGLSLLAELSAAVPLMPTICLTGRQDTSIVVRAMRGGAVDYLTKPVDKKTILTAVSTATQYAESRRGSGDESEKTLSLPIGDSPAWKCAVELMLAAANSPKTTVLLTGEPGVGKEIAASFLHRSSKRAHGPLVSANAACFTQALIESELFGHEAGAFTGAHRRRKGLFEQAEGGFLFLDEIGELPLALQSKLLRVIEGHAFRRVGGEEPIHCDVRLICATNRDLEARCREGLFRPDLLERLRVFEIALPPLRERREDIPHLAHHFLAKLGLELGRSAVDINPDAMDALQRHAWPGNVRELRNVIERALVLATGNTLMLQHFPHQLWRSPVSRTSVVSPEDVRLETMERRHIEMVFHDTGDNVTRSAERLGMSRLALRRKLQAYGLRPVRS